MKVQWHVVGFFDLLAQGDLMKDLLLPRGGFMDEKFDQNYRELVRPVIRHRECFQKALEHARGRWEAYHAPQELPAALRDGLGKLFRPNLQLRWFSDSVVLFSPLGEEGAEPQTVGLLEIITAAATVSLALLGEKTVLRGGITVNVGGVLPDGDLYGPVLGAAYSAEKSAEWPRVVLDPHAADFLEMALKPPEGNPLRLANNHVAKECKAMLYEPPGEKVMVDTFGSRFVGPPGDPVRELKSFKDGVTWVKEEEAKFRTAGHPVLAPRYRKLVEYIESRLGS